MDLALEGTWLALSNLLGWAACLATVFDAGENIALFFILTGNLGTHPQTAFWRASTKFGLLLLGLGYALAGGWSNKNKSNRELCHFFLVWV